MDLLERVIVDDNYSSYVEWATSNNKVILDRKTWESVMEWWCG